MGEDELMQKLVTELVSQRVMIKALLGVLAICQDPEHPEKAYRDLTGLMALGYEELRVKEAASLAENWKLPLSVALQLEQGPGSEFESWFRRETS